MMMREKQCVLVPEEAGGDPLNNWGQRILALVDEAPGPVAIVAPPGFGLTSIASLVRVHRPELDVVDNLTAARIDSEPLGPSSVLVSHSLPRGTNTRTTITHADLSYTEPEARSVAKEYGIDVQIADALAIMTGGWGCYFELCVEAVANGAVASAHDAVYHLRTGSHLDELVSRCTAGLPADDKEVAQIASSLGRTTVRVLERLGGVGVVERLQAAGLPLVETDGGQLKILAPIDEHLAGRDVLDEGLADEIGPLLAASAGSLQAARVLLQAGSPDAAGRLLKSMSAEEIEEASQDQLAATITTLLDVEKADAALSLLLARVYHQQGKLDLQRSSLIAASQTARDQLRLDVAVEAEAELLVLDVWSSPPQDASDRREELLEQSKGHANERTLIRIREISEAIGIHSYDLTTISRSVPRLEAISAQWEAIGENARAAATLRTLVATSVNHLGRYAHGADLMKKACTLTKSSPQGFLRSLSLLTRMHALAGHLTEFEESSARALELSGAVGLRWIDGYLAWSAMIVEGHRGNPGEVELQLRRATTLFDEVGLMDHHPTALLLACEAVRAVVQCGDLDRARTLLRSVEDKASHEQVEFELASFLVDCRTSPEHGSELAERLFDTVDVPMERRWFVDLELALATQNAEARDLAGKDAASHGLTALFDTLVRSEPRANVEQQVRVDVLGSFQVARDGQAVDLKSEKATQLLSFLAVRNKPVPNEVIIDHLWPEATTSVGVRRLRNVVRRAREAVGTDGLIRALETLSLGPHVEVDLSLLEPLLSKIEARPEESSKLVEEAIELYRGPLLEQLIYEDWVSVSRLDVGNRFTAALRLAITARGISPALALQAIRRIDTDDELLLKEARALAEAHSDQVTLRALESYSERSSLGRQRQS